MRTFQFDVYDDAVMPITTEFAEFEEKAQARAFAAKLVKKNGGPVDLAIAGDGDFSDRYITTASPSEYHTSGVRFERLYL